MTMRLLALLGLASAIGCAGDPIPLRDCTPGATLPCACVGGAAGAQVCTADAHLGACVCPDAGGPVDVVDDAPLDAGSDVATDAADAPDAPDAPRGVAAPYDDGCPAGRADCDHNPANGCEASLSSLENCGACGRWCGFVGATARCVAARCEFVACLANRGDCDGNAANGCETDLSPPRSCGTCATYCADRPNAVGSCSDDRCLFTCAAGWRDCDGNATNGCEARVERCP